MADKPFRPLFDDCRPVYRADCHFVCFLLKHGCEPRGDTAARKGKRNRQLDIARVSVCFCKINSSVGIEK